jgi:hypothetical protein
MIRVIRQQRAKKLLRSGAPRRILIHSVTPVPAFAERPRFVRVAFEFVDPPGPWSMQFYEGEARDGALLARLKPGSKAFFYESEDGARSRVLKDEEGAVLWPK